MNRHATNISAVFLKDLLQLWPLAALSAIAILAQTLFVHSNWLHNLAFLVPSVLIISLVQQDAPASLRHEWLTRPVSSIDVLIAKCLLAAGAILLPALVGLVVSAKSQGLSMSGTLLLAIAEIRLNLLGSFILLLVAALTSTMAQAAGVLAGLVLFLLAAGLSEKHGMRIWGSDWTVLGATVVITLVGGTVVLWYQYAQRRTMMARGAFATMIGIITIATALLVGSA